MEDKWQDNLRGAFDAYTESAPDGLWKGVQVGLVRVRRRRRIVAAVSAVSASAMALAAVLLLSPAAADDPLMPVCGGPLLSDASYTGLAVPELPSPSGLVGQPRTVSVREPESMPGTEKTVPDGQPEVASGVEKPEVENTDRAEADGMLDYFPEESATAPVGTRRAVVIAVSTSGMPGSSSSVQGYRALSTSNMLSVLSRRNQDGVFQTRSAASEGDFSMSGNSGDLYSSVRHHQPLRLELAASCEISGVFFLSGGLSWSMLVSDMSSGSSSVRYDSRQTLHYLGVPLSLGVSFPLSERLELSLSAGAMAAKCIYGTLSTDYVVSDVSRVTESQRVSIAPLQWSVQASASLGWKFSPALGVFIKPGLAYYFDDGSTVSTIYKDRPFNFDLSLGMRLYLR